MSRLLAPLWTLCILVACSLPPGDLPAQDVPGLDKAAHVLLFVGFGALWVQAAGRRRAWAVLVLGILFGILTEIYQGLLPWERTPDPYDALADAVGVLIGVGGMLALRRFVRSQSPA